MWSDRQARARLADRLRARTVEIEQAALVRIEAVPGSPGEGDPEYARGLRAAALAALEYGMAAVEQDGDQALDVPPVLIAQARLAARAGVSLDTVLRRYFAGFTLFADFLVEELEAEKSFKEISLHRLLRTQATHFDRLVVAVSEAHAHERERRFRTSEQRQAERVKRMLAGDLVETSDLPYEFERWHVAVVANGAGVAETVRDAVATFDSRLLLVEPHASCIWVWLGSSRRLDPGDFLERLPQVWPSGASLTVGEAGFGLLGWRTTHRQAMAAQPIAQRGPRRVVRYRHVALLVSIVGDDLLAGSLRQIYLAPLDGERDGGTTLRATLRTYFATGRNVSSAAAALGVTRRTITNHLRRVEERLGSDLDACAAELEAALGLEELSSEPAVQSENLPFSDLPSSGMRGEGQTGEPRSVTN